MKKRCAVLATMLLAGLLVSAGSTGVARQIPQLAGTTTVSGRNTALARVVLPRPVQISSKTFDNPVASISTTGQLAGVVLKHEDRGRSAELIAFSVDPCEARPCDQRRVEFVNTHPARGRKKITLPAGPYLLYLISDGAPVTVTLRLPGLAGKTSVRPTAKAASSFEPLSPWALGDAAKVTYNASRELSIENVGITLVALEVEADAHLAGEYTSCLRPAPEDAPSPVTEQMCSGSVGGWTLLTPTPDPGRALLVGMALQGQGRYVHGASYRSAAAVTDVRAFGFSLSYVSGTRRSQSFSNTLIYESGP